MDTSRLRIAAALVFGVLVWLVGPSEVVGQVQVSVTGEKASTDVVVSTLLNGIKTRRDNEGETDSEIRVPANAFAEGSEVQVYVRMCVDGRTEIVLAAAGEGDVCADQAGEAGERCGCEKLGAFHWRDGARIAVDPSTNAITVTGTSPVVVSPPVKPLRFGASMDYHHFGNWEEVACDQPESTGCTSESGGYSGGVFVEYLFPGSRFGLGAEARYGMAPDATIDYPGFRSEVTTDFFSIAPYTTVHWTYDGFEVMTLVGLDYVYNLSDISVPPGDFGNRETIDRNDGNWNVRVGAEYRIPISDSWSAAIRANYSSSFDEEDADSNIWSIGVGLLDP